MKTEDFSIKFDNKEIKRGCFTLHEDSREIPYISIPLIWNGYRFNTVIYDDPTFTFEPKYPRASRSGMGFGFIFNYSAICHELKDGFKKLGIDIKAELEYTAQYIKGDNVND